MFPILIEELARQREREIAARTRSPLVTHDLTARTAQFGRTVQRSRSERGRAKVPPLSIAKWRHWAARGRNEVHCSRASANGRLLMHGIR